MVFVFTIISPMDLLFLDLLSETILFFYHSKINFVLNQIKSLTLSIGVWDAYQKKIGVWDL